MVDFNSPIERRGRFVGEIALYLIEAITTSNIYFAQDCSLEIDGEEVSDASEVHEKTQAIASKLRKRKPSELENLTLEDLLDIMKKKGLGFPQGDS